MQTLEGQLTQALDDKVLIAEKMRKHTTIKIGGNADILVLATKKDSIIRTMELAKKNKVDLTTIGNGSNLIVSDLGIRGIVLKICSSQNIPQVDGEFVTVFTGVPLGKLINLTIDEGLGGLEGLVGIPGSLGGAIVMNAGTANSEIGEMVNWVKVIDKESLEIKTLTSDQLGFSYRNSVFQRDQYILLEANLHLNKECSNNLRLLKAEIIKERNNKQPVKFPNSGSIFKNPPNNSAGRLIEETGLKGYAVGDAQISNQHANFIINKGNAKAVEVLELMNMARKAVYNKTNIVLKPEVKFLGGGLKLEEV